MNIDQILANPTLRARIEKALAARGNGGDTMIAHINPREAGILRSLGGSGTINPRTGIRQFDPAGFGGGPGGLHDGTAESRSGIGGDSGGGSDINASRGHVGTGNPVQGGRIDPSRVGTDTVDRSSMQAHAGPMHDSPYANASDSYLSRSWLDKLRDWVTNGGPFSPPGFHMSEPTYGDPASYAGGTYHTGLNPAGLVAGVGGMVSGVPGLGTALDAAASAAYNALGYHDIIVGGPGGIFGGGGSTTGTGNGYAGGVSGGAANGGLGGGYLGGSFGGGSIGGNGNGGNGGFFGGVSGGAANGGLGPTTPTGPTAPAQQQATQAAQSTAQAQQTAAAQTPPASPALMPLMSQASPDLTGGRFGPVPSFATQPYQIGTTPVNMAPPQIPGTPFAGPPATGGTGGGTGGTGGGTSGGTQNSWQQSFLAQYPQLAQWLQANPVMARRWGYA